MKRGTIVIPTTSTNAETVIDRVETILCNEYGGCTIVEGRGSWVDDTNNVVTEDNVTVWSTSEDLTMERMSDIAKFVKFELGEDAVLVMVDEPEVKFV